MLISHTKKFVFVHIPKTAGTSISCVLEKYCEKAPDTKIRRIMRKLRMRQPPELAHFRSHDTAAQVRSAFGPEVYQQYLVFSVVRNPFDHAVSHYTFMREFSKPNAAHHFAKMSFSDYLDFRAQPGIFSRLPPFARLTDQTAFLDDGKGRIIVPDLLHFETLADDVAALVQRLGLPASDLPHARPTKGRCGTLESFYADPATEAKLRRLYARDFANFGYPEDWRTGLVARG